MNFKKYRSRFLLVFATLTLLFSSVLLTSCQGKKIKNTVFSVDDLAGKTIGVQLGTEKSGGLDVEAEEYTEEVQKGRSGVAD